MLHFFSDNWLPAAPTEEGWPADRINPTVPPPQELHAFVEAGITNDFSNLSNDAEPQFAGADLLQSSDSSVTPISQYFNTTQHNEATASITTRRMSIPLKISHLYDDHSPEPPLQLPTGSYSGDPSYTYLSHQICASMVSKYLTYLHPTIPILYRLQVLRWSYAPDMADQVIPPEVAFGLLAVTAPLVDDTESLVEQVHGTLLKEPAAYFVRQHLSAPTLSTVQALLHLAAAEWVDGDTHLTGTYLGKSLQPQEVRGLIKSYNAVCLLQ